MPDREYRGKRLDDGEWVEGYYVAHAGCCHSIIPAPFGGYIAQDGTFYAPVAYMVDPSTVSPYIGHTDKDGAKVFGGDILYDPHRRCNLTVRYDNERSMWLAEGDGWNIPLHELPVFSCKVIGNRWDPDLMGDDQHE